MYIDNLLKTMVKMNASDLHLRVGSPPMFRIFGKLTASTDLLPLQIKTAN